MNLTNQSENPTNLLFVNFNQDCTSLAVGAKTGYKLFSLNSVDKLEQIYENETADVSVVERLFSSSLVAIVSLSSPRKLKVCHFKKGTEICNYSYSNSILAVKLNRQRLIVCLEESLYIHNIRDMKVLHTIRDTPPNPHGLCALSINNDNSFLAYPGSNQIGEVQIFDTVNLRAVTMIPAHDNKLAALGFNSAGTRLATASEKGTVIRVFSIPDGQKLFEFRRGVKRCVSIHSLAFSVDSLYLAASSNTETIHIFKLEVLKDKYKGKAPFIFGSNSDFCLQSYGTLSTITVSQFRILMSYDNSNKRPPEEQQGWMGYFGQALKTSAHYLPTQVSDMLNQGRAFATCRLPCSGLHNLCALAIIQKLPRLLVASQDGYLYIYNLDPNEGGECMLLRQHRLDGRLTETHAVDPGPSDRPLTQTGMQSYAATLRKNDDATIETTDSLPYQELDAGAVGGETDLQRVHKLRLDDDNEFPPMTHKHD